jgi:hypothetical protein
VPFLQPLHGYPHHYYNMTGEGLRNLFRTCSSTAIEITPSKLASRNGSTSPMPSTSVVS